MKDTGTLFTIVWFFAVLSLFSIGGSNSVVPEMHREAVSNEHWLTDRQFSDIFAISQAAPGPSNLIVALIGLKAGGVTGAVIAQLAMLVPASVVMYLVARMWVSSSSSAWHAAMERGLAPIAVGLLFASGWVVAKGADHSWPAYCVSGLCTVLFWKTKANPLLVMVIAGFFGWMKWI